MNNSGCIFCEILNNSKFNQTFIFKLKYGNLFLNKKQYYKGRCLYILNDHIENYHEIDSNTFIGFNEEVKVVGKLLFNLFKPDLINYALLGNHIQHVHWHIIPRYKSDKKWGYPPWPSPSDEEINSNELNYLVAKIKNEAYISNIISIT
jgi:diadenosine tetraphosphate (Ap4A) HIT family hydrolase